MAATRKTALGRRRLVARMVGGACLAAAGLAILWPGAPVGPRVIDGEADSIDVHLAASDRKLRLKAAVVTDLVAGRLTFMAAVDRFEVIEAQCPEFAELSRRHLESVYAGRNFRERLAYSLLSYCEARLQHEDYWAEVVLARLEAELAAFIGRPTSQRKGP